MDKYSPDTDALEKIVGDMDDMESEKMFKKPEEDHSKGVNITISVEPKTEEKKMEAEPLEAPIDDEMKLPPFLRSKKK